MEYRQHQFREIARIGLRGERAIAQILLSFVGILGYGVIQDGVKVEGSEGHTRS
jgi:hypothetical protein